MARTNIDLDEEACRRVMERFGLQSTSDAVNLALRRLAPEPLALVEARALRGSGWDGDLYVHAPMVRSHRQPFHAGLGS
jgi:Arc/MetJ family transcription regulator